MEHLESNKNEVLQQMEKYKFDEPLNVAVIYEDPDDEVLIAPTQRSTKKCVDTSLTNGTNTSSTISEISHQGNIIDGIQYTSSIECSNKSVEDNIYNNDGNNHQHFLFSYILGQGKEPPTYNNSNNTYDSLLISLDTLSENLIRISQAGFKTNYFRSNQHLYDKAKKYYLYVKIKMFKASFNIAANVIIPQENNRSFLERFINGTVSIARCKSLERISKEIVESLIIDLIKWTKYEIRRIDTRMSNAHLNKELYQNTTACSVQKPSNNRLEENMTNISNSRKRSLFPNSHWERQLDNNTDALTQPNIHNVCCSTSDRIYSSTSPKRLKDHDNMYEVQMNFHNNVNDKYFRLPSQNEHAQMNSSTISPSSSIGRGSWNELRVNDNVDQYLLLRSVSRDSGIESPSCSNWQSNNPMEAMYDNASIEIVNIALSTTSTNMNSNVPFEPYCSVCQKATKDVCIGCERQFYCSLECQNVDWNVHKHFCKR